ncbi:hypothetical protein [Sulfitobacter sp. R18_1]|uniref:hypothetical protein n=1 Tax=Sulfitobacter sp. R18_1 TaxID=2821104 RepID=UPI001ADA343A|nr:hypothetical protein [Sulfitobacter sp. R18_1]MBO9428743.1 hypothetical protein [Sulfitobacter sp. R18_1]
MRILGLCLVVSLLVACAPNTVGDLRKSPGSVTEMHLNENYQSVYRRLTTQGRACFDVNLVTAQRMIRSELYSDLGVAEISYEMFGVNNEVYAVADIVKDGDGTTLKITSAKGAEEMDGVIKKHLAGRC